MSDMDALWEALPCVPEQRHTFPALGRVCLCEQLAKQARTHDPESFAVWPTLTREGLATALEKATHEPEDAIGSWEWGLNWQVIADRVFALPDAAAEGERA